MSQLQTDRTDAESLLQRSPAISWRTLPVGVYVRDHASGANHVLDAAGSAMFRRTAAPIQEAALLEAVEDAAEASGALARMLAAGILLRPGMKPRRTAGHAASAADTLIDELVTSNCIRTGRPYSAAIEGARRFPAAPESPLPVDGLTAAVWGRTLEELAYLGTVSLSVLGAETLRNPDTLFVLREARRLGFAVTLYIEGCSGLAEEVAAELAELYLEDIWVTLRGGDAATHDQITSVPGSFDRTIAAIRALTRLGQPVKINGLPQRADPEDRTALRRLTSALACSLVMDPFLFAPTADQKARRETKKLRIRPSIFLQDDGSVRSCRAFEPLEANLAQDSILELWHTSVALRATARLPLHSRAGCRECVMRTTCFGCGAGE